MTRLLLAAAALAAAVAACLGAGTVRRLDSRTVGLLTALAVAALLTALIGRPVAWWASDLVVLLVAAVVGGLIAWRLPSDGALLAFCVAASAVDVVSFAFGPTRRILEGFRAGSSDLLLALTFSIPLAGRPVPVIGLGDLVVAATIFAALAASGYPRPTALLTPVGGLAAALVVGLTLGPIPAIPWIALPTMVLVYRRSR